jgi:hypothetical protein
MRKVLFIISSDPRASHRPAEAIRIAAGTGAWARAEVNVCLIGPATLMLGESEEALKDADQFSACLPILREARRPIYLLSETKSPTDDSAVQEISLRELSRLALQHDVVARF